MLGTQTSPAILAIYERRAAAAGLTLDAWLARCEREAAAQARQLDARAHADKLGREGTRAVLARHAAAVGHGWTAGQAVRS